MKIKNKGKVYPSPSSSSSSSSASNDREVLTVLKLLPAAILALASVLSLEDREVLAYMITRSMKTPSSSSSSMSTQQESKKKSSKKGISSSTINGHKPPMFDCDCFDCYTSYWFRWDSSHNRELIHQVIEAFEDHLTHGEKSKKSNGRGKRRDRFGRTQVQKPVLEVPAQAQSLAQAHSHLQTPAEMVAENNPCVELEVSPETNVVVSTPVLTSPEKADNGYERSETKEEENENDAVEKEASSEVVVVDDDDVAVVVRTMTMAANDQHKGLARKVLPDVLGLFNSRLWSLWSPNA